MIQLSRIQNSTKANESSNAHALVRLSHTMFAEGIQNSTTHAILLFTGKKRFL